MTPIARLAEACLAFDSSWRAHACSMRAVQLLRGSGGLEVALQAALTIAKGFPSEFNAAHEFDDLLEELDWLRDEQFEPLRRNCLLGVCASFENSVKVAATALSFGPAWVSSASDRARLDEDCDDAFGERFDQMDREWKGKQSRFFATWFPYLDTGTVAGATDAMWLRNQIVHNASRARSHRDLQALGLRFDAGDTISLTQPVIGAAVLALRECVVAAFKGSPYLEHF